MTYQQAPVAEYNRGRMAYCSSSLTPFTAVFGRENAIDRGNLVLHVHGREVSDMLRDAVKTAVGNTRTASYLNNYRPQTTSKNKPVKLAS